MKLSLRRVARLVFGLCLLMILFGGFLSPVHAAEPNAELAWAWAVNCPCTSCECTPAKNCGCLVTIAALAEPVGYQEVQVCENGKCKIVRVPVYANTPATAQKSEPLAVAWSNASAAGNCAGGQCFAPTTVQGYGAGASYAAPSGGYQLFRPVQNLREWNQSRPRLFGGNRGRGSCCGG